jgi:diguanylate cyclase (GGDEF)-like protein
LISSNTKTDNPLTGLPSMLAIRDLRRRIRKSVAGQDPDRGLQARLLSLDPLTVLRCLRQAYAPINNVGREIWTIGDLQDVLGNTLVLRALESPVTDLAGTGPIRKLWLHSLAAAHAARTLARSTGCMDPERAYLLGLLHDLPLWLHYLSLRQNGSAPKISAVDWVRHWNLPKQFGETIEQIALGCTDRPTSTPTDAASLVCAAETLAELADFWHPDAGDPTTRELMLSMVTREDLVSAQNLRLEVAHSLGHLGLEFSAMEPDPVALGLDPHEDLSLFPAKQHGDLSDLVLTLLDCSKAESYRGIITASTSAALRFLGFDRAWYVQWVRATGRCFVRAKADLSRRRLEPLMVRMSPAEVQILTQALETDEPQLTTSGIHSPQGLLRELGADEALIVPLNVDFNTPAFLILDRALSARPVRLQKESVAAKTLAGTTSLLTENLFLKKRRSQAQKFALSDPLTHLSNRTVGINSLSQEVARAKRSGSGLTVLMLDLDDFKKLNDTHGHLMGDQALRATADVLRKTLRTTDTICRYGGEEFLVVLPETSVEDGSVLATRLFTAVEFQGEKMKLPITVSIGLAGMRSESDEAEAILQRADRALYASKARGRNRFSVDVE